MLSYTVALRSGLDSLPTSSIEPLFDADFGRNIDTAFVFPDLDEVLTIDRPGLDVLVQFSDLVCGS